MRIQQENSCLAKKSASLYHEGPRQTDKKKAPPLQFTNYTIFPGNFLFVFISVQLLSIVETEDDRLIFFIDTVI